MGQWTRKVSVNWLVRAVARAGKRAFRWEGRKERKIIGGIGKGLVLRLDPATEAGLLIGLYEMELNKYIRKMCRPTRRGYDVGGQFGYDALVMARLTGARVVSFESEQEFVREIELNVASNPGLEVEPVMAFVGEDPPALRLDDYATSSGWVPEYIKMDIEGGELQALRGAESLLRRFGPDLLLEVHSEVLESSCIGLLKSYGYEHIEVVDQRKVLPDHRPTRHNRWLFARASVL